ncbi:MAG TPA: hypothetical protein VM510_15380 [Caulifigura sp.]|nr:hypothetical protein [Caulifigura sp.]
MLWRPAGRWAAFVVAIVVAMPDRARAQPAAGELEIDIKETVWGFDGKTVREAFVPLSILVQNQGSKPISGAFRLTRMVPRDAAREPQVEVPFDVPPFEERWVQMAPFIVDEYIPYELRWGPRDKQKIELPQARIGDPAIVLLTNPNDRPRPSGGLRRFRTNLFPASVSATDGLQAVFLDGPPDFQGARLQAFLEWLHSGGTVVILHDDNHSFPKFPSALAVLNEARDSHQVGAGRVQRLGMQARDVDEALIRQTVLPLQLRRSSNEAASAFTDPYRVYNGHYPWSRDRAVLEKLESVTRFHRRWWLIYPLAILYLVAVFPGTFAIAHTSRGVRWFYTAYFAAAVLFSWAFKTLGGVGGGESNRVRTATIAHQLSPGLFDCSQWDCLASVNGGLSTLQNEGSGRLYGPCEEFETPHGLITSGSEAKYEVDIPVASTRSAVSRFRANAPPVSAELQSTEFLDQRLANCSVVFSGLPSQPLEAFVCHRDSILRLKESQGSWKTDRRRAQITSIFVSNLDRARDYTVMAAQREAAIDDVLSDEFYRSFERLLVGNSFRIRGQVDPWSGSMLPGRLRVLALCAADGAFAPKADGFDDVQGCVLYVMDLPISEN